jgi:hypothetical protein
MCFHLLLCLRAFASLTFFLFVCVWNPVWRGHQGLKFSLSVCFTACIKRLQKLFTLLLVQLLNVLRILLVSIKFFRLLTCLLEVNELNLFFSRGKATLKDRNRLFRSVIIVATLGLVILHLLVSWLLDYQRLCVLLLVCVVVNIS